MKDTIILKVIYFTAVILSLAQPLLAQSKINKSINFSVENEKLSTALYRLANECDINFSYDAGDSIFNTKLSYTANNEPPLVILEHLLLNTNHNYKKVGNQIVIYTDVANYESPQLFGEITDEADSVDEVMPMQNNVLITPTTDTIYIQDTIVKILTDTILITDTVFLEKERLKKPPTTKIKDIPADFFKPSVSREEGWSTEIFFAPILSNFSLTQQSNTFTVRNFSLGVEASKILKRWNITGGFKLTQFSEKYNHTSNITEGGYYITDTIDEYYTVSQADTAWYYITDSTWKPIDNYESSYNVNNRIGYIEFTASVSYDFYKNRKLRLYAVAGAQLGFMIYSNGVAIPDPNEPEGVDFANLNFNTLSYSILAGAGMKYRINEYFDVNTEIYYLHYFNDVVIDYPVNNKVVGIGLKLGLIYYF